MDAKSPVKKRKKTGRVSPRSFFAFIKDSKEICSPNNERTWRPPLKANSECIQLSQGSVELGGELEGVNFSEPNLKLSSSSAGQGMAHLSSDFQSFNEVNFDEKHSESNLINSDKDMDSQETNNGLYDQKYPNDEYVKDTSLEIIDCCINKHELSNIDSFHSSFETQETVREIQIKETQVLSDNWNSKRNENYPLEKSLSERNSDLIKSNPVDELTSDQPSDDFRQIKSDDCNKLHSNSDKFENEHLSQGEFVNEIKLNEFGNSSRLMEQKVNEYFSNNILNNERNFESQNNTNSEKNHFSLNKEKESTGSQEFTQKIPDDNEQTFGDWDCEDPFDVTLSNSQFLKLEKEVSVNHDKFLKPEFSVSQYEAIDRQALSVGRQIEWQKTVIRRMINDVEELNKVVMKATSALRTQHRGFRK